MKKSKAISIKKTYPAEFRERVEHVVYTKYTTNPEQKEQDLVRIFDYYGFEYSLEIVKQIIFAGYLLIGGYKTYEEFTNHIK